MTQLLRRTLGLLFPDNASVREETNLLALGKLSSLINYGNQLPTNDESRARVTFRFAIERRRSSARPYILSISSFCHEATKIGGVHAAGSRGYLYSALPRQGPPRKAKGAACTTLLTARHNEGQRPTSFSRQLRNAERKIGTAAVLCFQTRHGYYYWVSRTAPQVSRHFSSSSTDHIIVSTSNIDYIIRY
jgi:hypothetical protein